jgi:cytochrome P450 PksS
VVTRFAEVAAIHRDHAQFGSRAGVGSVAEQAKASLRGNDRRDYEELQRFRRFLMAREDGEAHRRMRGIAHRAFTPRRIAALRSDIEAYMQELIEGVEVLGLLDISELAYRLPLRVIGNLLDIPKDHHEQMHEWSHQYAQGSTSTDPASIRRSLEAVDKFKTYSDELLQQWRRAPENSELVASLIAGNDGLQLTALELAGTFTQLIIAAQETTSRLISRGIYELLRRRDQWSMLSADPDGLAANATEELLRIVSPLPFQARVPLTDVTIGGLDVKAGTTVYPILACANRDPEIFEDPDSMNLQRTNARQHLAFGVGLHFCLGASLARMEGIIAFGSLARSFPEMELTRTADDGSSQAEPRDRKHLVVSV